MSKEHIPIFLKPLMIPEWGFEVHSPQSSNDPAPMLLLSSLCSLDAFSESSTSKKRYRELTEIDQNLFVSIEGSEIKRNLFDPLRQAKTSYVLDNYVGSIAISGIVAEKLAALILVMRNPHSIGGVNLQSRLTP